MGNFAIGLNAEEARQIVANCIHNDAIDELKHVEEFIRNRASSGYYYGYYPGSEMQFIALDRMTKFFDQSLAEKISATATKIIDQLHEVGFEVSIEEDPSSTTEGTSIKISWGFSYD